MSTITTIQESDVIRDSRVVINTNFDNLNSDKLEEVGISDLTASGTPGAGTFLRGDNQWVSLPGGGDMLAATYDPAGISEQLVGTDAAQTLVNKTIDATSNSISNVNLSTDVAGNLPVTYLNSGTGANADSYWRGDGTWDTYQKNEGVVKVNGDATGSPSWVLVASTEQQMTLTLPLTISSATDWPNNITSPTDADFYLTATDKFIENPIEYQVHTWRIIVDWTVVSATATEVLTFKLRNPISGFEIIDNSVLPKGITAGTSVFTAISIADSASIGVGYQFFLESTTTPTVTLGSITRVSAKKD